VDTSVDPLFNERHLGGPAFPGAPLAPYHPSRSNLLQPGDSAVLEIPVSSGTLPRLPRALEAAYARLKPTRWRPLGKRLGVRPAWLRPSYSPVKDATALAAALVAQGVPTLNMLFHSSELWPGGSPYARDEAAVDRFLDSLERVFAFVVGTLHATPMTLAQYAARRAG
jgi:hypothetical protein